MKKIFLSIALIICSFTYACSQETRVQKIITLAPMQGADKLTPEALKSINRKKTELPSYKGDTYKFENIILFINADTGTFTQDALEKRKLSYDELSANLPKEVNYHSEIRQINNYKVLIKRYDAPPNYNGYSRFTVEGINVANNKTFVGIIEYDKADEAKAKKVLETILMSARFK